MSNNFSSKKVDVVSSVVNTLNLDKEELKFYDIISQDYLSNTKKEIRGKRISFEKLEDNDQFFIGFIQSEITKNIPPKLNGTTNQIEALNLSEVDSLVYGNIFLYDKINDFLFYEINSNSIYLDGFCEFLHSFNELKVLDVYEVKFSTIYKKDQYQKALGMDIYKKFKMLIRQPSRYLEEMKIMEAGLTDEIALSFKEEVQKAIKFNSDSSEIIFNVDKPKTKGGLAKEWMHLLLKDYNFLSTSKVNDYISKVEVVGYTEESERSLTKFNLLGDIYFLRMRLEVFRVGIDLQKNERKEKIIDLYNNNISDLKSYI
ncbi:hypothetical protein HX024_17840 [Myroides marinus]|uniref:hypothetical protein n=1 Tax=Myroides marinus TaxID=703342 RepID=UPI00257865E1|nr:hypothetical protein [Myroides marinus]MDM1384524.1 hypothetical protein [Myroides marinus]